MPKHTPFDWHLLDSLLALNASLDYCAEKQIERNGEEVNKRTIINMRSVIEHRVKKRHGMLFREYRTKKLEAVGLSIFSTQLKVARDGNPTMLIWMGKQLLNQTDKVTDPNEKAVKFVVIDKVEGGQVVGQTELQKHTRN